MTQIINCPPTAPPDTLADALAALEAKGITYTLRCNSADPNAKGRFGMSMKFDAPVGYRHAPWDYKTSTRGQEAFHTQTRRVNCTNRADTLPILIHRVNESYARNMKKYQDAYDEAKQKAMWDGLPFA